MTEEFSDSEEDEDNPNDLEYVSELDGRSGNSKLRKKSSDSSAASALSESLISSVANKPQSGNLEELTINEWKLSLWVKVLYEGETYIGKVINIQNNVSKNHLGSIQIIFMIWRRKTVVHFTKLSIRLM